MDASCSKADAAFQAMLLLLRPASMSESILSLIRLFFSSVKKIKAYALYFLWSTLLCCYVIIEIPERSFLPLNTNADEKGKRFSRVQKYQASFYRQKVKVNKALCC